MLPKEKESRLFEITVAKFPPQSSTPFNVFVGAKLCCLNTCDVVISSHTDKNELALGERDIPIIDYWRAVKKEIELIEIPNN